MLDDTPTFPPTGRSAEHLDGLGGPFQPKLDEIVALSHIARQL
jgi:hypothetical protein